MSVTQEQLSAAIQALEGQRPVLGNSVVDIALAPLREQLAALQRGQVQQLKQVSVLFVDTVGSTAMSQRLGPEQIHAVMDGALARYTALVQTHRGRVLQYAGDSLLAAFGTEQAQEDDPELAVQAGLAILAESALVAADTRQQFGIKDYAVRAGVHTGAVLLGGGVDEAGTIRGATVNIAARMEQSAPPGGLRISHDTWRHVRGRFDLQEQPLITVKGVANALRNYLVKGRLDRQQRRNLRGVEGAAAPLIGRAAELAQLHRQFELAVQQSSVALVTVVGDAGMGKSRLRAEFEHGLLARPEPVWLLRGHGTLQRSASPYGVLQDLLFERFAIQDSDAQPTAQRKLLEGLATVLHERAAEHAALLGQLIGLDFSDSPHVRGLGGDARQLRDRGLHALAQYLLELHRSNRGAVVLMLDDLHWADAGSLQAVSYLARHAEAMPLLLLCLARGSLYDSQPDWGQAAAWHLRLDLQAFDTQTSTDLIDALLARLADVPSALRQLIVDNAAGNPFYMEELTAMLIDDGVIDTSGDAWRVDPERLAGLRVPGTLKGVLQARLDSLSPLHRQELQLASVIGHDFWDRPLQQLNPASDAALPQLQHQDLVLPHLPSAFEGAQQYSFKHHLLHQVTYDSVLARVKRSAHAQVAAWLVSQGTAARPELVADHFERAGDNANAAEYWYRSALAAESRYANAQALTHARRALELTSPSDRARCWALLLVVEKALHRLEQTQDRAACLEQIRALAEELDDDACRCRWATLQANHLQGQGQSAAAFQLAQQAVGWAPADKPALLAVALEVTGNVLERQGRLDEATRQLDGGLAASQRANDLPTQARILNELGMVANDQGDAGRASELFAQALAIHRQTGNRSNEAGTLSNLAFTWMGLGEYAQAHAQFTEALTLCLAIGKRGNRAVIHINVALVLLCQGQASAAREQAGMALDVLRGLGDTWAEAAAWRVLGHAHLASGQSAEAVQGFERSRELFDGLGLDHLAVEAIAGLALECHERGALAEALNHVQTILDRQAAGAGLAGTDEPLRIGLICWQVLADAGDARAAEVLARAQAELQRRASCITDARWRDSYLWQVPHHRLLMQAGGSPATVGC